MGKSEKSLPRAVNQPGFQMAGEHAFAFLKGNPGQYGYRSTASASDYLDAARSAGSNDAEADLLYQKHRRGIATPTENRHMARILAEFYKKRGISVFSGTAG